LLLAFCVISSGLMIFSLGLAVASDEFERFLLTVALYLVFVSSNGCKCEEFGQ